MRLFNRPPRSTPAIGAQGRNPTRRHYRTRYRPTDYVFDFHRLPGGTWRVYIVWQPAYGRRASDMHSSHRLGLSERPYICWDTPIRTLADAQQVASEWADRTQRYIATGTPIDRSW